MSVSIHEHEFVVAERDALRREVDRLKSEGDKLDATAVVGNARFGRGVAWRTVIMAAQRQHQETVTPESGAARLEKVAETNLIVSLRDAEIARLNEELAASQAREQQLREALDYVNLHNTVVGSLLMGAHSECPDTWRGYYDDALNHSDYITKRLESAITLQSDTTALEAMISKAGEVMREAAQNACTSKSIGTDHDDFDEWDYCNYGCADSIRALPDVTLEDLK